MRIFRYINNLNDRLKIFLSTTLTFMISSAIGLYYVINHDSIYDSFLMLFLLIIFVVSFMVLFFCIKFEKEDYKKYKEAFKIRNRVISSQDPYGEENWED